LLTVTAGSDPADAATRRPTGTRSITPPRSCRIASARIGVMRFASGFGTDTPFEAALAVLRNHGATLVDIKEFDDKDRQNEPDRAAVEFKTGLNDYLSS
jgi:amidase